jgi:pilus assembly protein Flp/PilA
MESAAKRLRSYARDDRAATSIEYGLMATFIALAMLTAVTTAGLTLADVFQQVADML